jgi:transketolase
MGAALNGISLSGISRVFGGTFLVFSDYMRGAVRVAAVMQVPVTYVWTHDSIGVGEDGPTHQPVEHVWSLRMIPGLSVVRPADANETAAAWLETLKRHEPVGLILSRQNLPTLDAPLSAVRDGVARGGYVIADAENPQVQILATGSEVSLAVEAAQMLAQQGIAARVISLPCLEWFEKQDRAYRDSVIIPSVRARVSVEAGATLGWHKYVGDAGRCVGLDHFGASADAKVLYREFNITVDAIVVAAQESITASRRV